MRPRPVKTLRTVAFAGLLVALVATPAAQAAAPRFGQVLVHAADWSGGVDVRSDSLAGCPRKVHGACAVRVVHPLAQRPAAPHRRGVRRRSSSRCGSWWPTAGSAERCRSASKPSQLYSTAPATPARPPPGHARATRQCPVTSSSGTVRSPAPAAAVRSPSSTGSVPEQCGTSSMARRLLSAPWCWARPDVRQVVGYLHARANTANIPGTQHSGAPNAARRRGR